jgi:hypothetical protein
MKCPFSATALSRERICALRHRLRVFRMRGRPKISPRRIVRPRIVRPDGGPMFVTSVAVTCIVLALAVDVLTSGADEAAPAAPAAPIAQALPAPAPAAAAPVATAFVIVREAPAAAVQPAPAPVPAATPQANSHCGDFDFSFLNASCSTTWKKHPERLHRPATFVAGVAHGPLSGKTTAVPGGPAKPPTIASVVPPDRVTPPIKKPKPAITAGLAVAVQ